MKTLKQLSLQPLTIPTRTSWYLADLSESRGKQDLFTHQSPQKLKVLREHALIESAVSSNRLTRREFLNQTTAVVAALRAGAQGAILSRKCSEMQLANLAAAGRAARDAGA